MAVASTTQVKRWNRNLYVPADRMGDRLQYMDVDGSYNLPAGGAAITEWMGGYSDGGSGGSLGLGGSLSMNGAFILGAFNSSAHAHGLALSADQTAAMNVFADDNNAAIGSGTLIRAGRFRTLLTYTGGNREQEAAGIVGQINSVGGTNRHNMCGVMGSYELSGSAALTVDGQAASTDAWIQAAVIGRVGVGTSKTTINANGVLAGVAAMSNTTSLAGNSGVYTAFYAGAWGSTLLDWAYGLYIESDKCTTGIRIGTCSGCGIDFPSGSTYGAAIRIGTWATPVVYSSDELVEIHGRVGSATETKPCFRVQNRGFATGAMTTGNVTAIEALAYSTSTHNLAEVEAIRAHVGIHGACTVLANVQADLPNMRAAWLKIEDLGNDLTLTGDAACIVLAKQFTTGTTLSGDSAFIWLLSEGTVDYNLNAIIQGKDRAGSGLATNLLDIPASAPYSAANSGGSQSGKIAIYVGGATKYIQCYSN